MLAEQPTQVEAEPEDVKIGVDVMDLMLDDDAGGANTGEVAEDEDDDDDAVVADEGGPAQTQTWVFGGDADDLDIDVDAEAEADGYDGASETLPRQRSGTMKSIAEDAEEDEEEEEAPPAAGEDFGFEDDVKRRQIERDVQARLEAQVR